MHAIFSEGRVTYCTALPILAMQIAADVRNRGFSGYLVGLHLQLRRWQATLLRIPGGEDVQLWPCDCYSGV